MATNVEYNLFNLIQDLEKRKQEYVSIAQVANAIGVHRHTLESMVNNATDDKFRKRLAELLDYFRSNGLPITIEQLFKVTTDTDGPPYG